MLRIYPIIVFAATLSACSSLENRLDAASEKQGQVEARVTLPAYPDDCRRQTPHAAIEAGMEALSVLKRERGQLDKANARTRRCTAFYEGLRENLK